MKIEVIKDTCTACSACANACANDAITLSEDKEGFYMPNINHDLCVNCGKCDSVCPILNLKDEKQEIIHAYCGYVKDDQVRKKSSSGGFFRALADTILTKGGIVYGAAFQYGDNLRLEHHSTNDVSIEDLQRSKYVQSYVGDSFKNVKKDLNEGKDVLFVGTPCQVNGLVNYLGGKNYPNLLTIDFICHGVPSMRFLREHLQHVGFENLDEVKDINFRPKISSWVDYIKVSGKRKKYLCYYTYDAYFKGFDKVCTTLRRSCYTCSYCNGKNRMADITLADFWGYSKTMLKIDYATGLSLLFAYSHKGKAAIESLENVELLNVDIDDTEYVFRRNRAEYYPYNQRQQFFGSYVKYGYERAIKDNGLYTTKISRIYLNSIVWLKRKIRSILSKL